MVEKGAAGRGQFDFVHAAVHQRDADLVFEIADLAAQRGLGGVQPLLRGDRKASCLRDRDKIAKVAQLHSGLPYLRGMPLSSTKSFSSAPGPTFRLAASMEPAPFLKAAAKNFRSSMLCR